MLTAATAWPDPARLPFTGVSRALLSTQALAARVPWMVSSSGQGKLTPIIRKATQIAYGPAGCHEIASMAGEPGSLVGAKSVTLLAHRSTG